MQLSLGFLIVCQRGRVLREPVPRGLLENSSERPTAQACSPLQFAFQFAAQSPAIDRLLPGELLVKPFLQARASALYSFPGVGGTLA